jgi:hypothetical protein
MVKILIFPLSLGPVTKRAGVAVVGRNLVKSYAFNENHIS